VSDDHRPLVLTAELDEETFAWLDALRRRHFPPERNHLSAHLTLFHALPGSCHDRVVAELEGVASIHAAVAGTATSWILLGRGVAIALDVPGIVAMRSELARRLAEVLTPQDAGGFRAHVTVQNKVTPERARALKAALDANFAPRAVRIPALRLYRYDGGPWEFARRFALAADAPAMDDTTPTDADRAAPGLPGRVAQ
jgi:hypothetical protein